MREGLLAKALDQLHLVPNEKIIRFPGRVGTEALDSSKLAQYVAVTIQYVVLDWPSPHTVHTVFTYSIYVLYLYEL